MNLTKYPQNKVETPFEGGALLRKFCKGKGGRALGKGAIYEKWKKSFIKLFTRQVLCVIIYSVKYGVLCTDRSRKTQNGIKIYFQEGDTL